MIRVVSKSSLNVIQLSLFHALSLPAAWWLNSTDSSLWPVETVIVCVSVCVSVHRVLTEEWSRHTHSTVRAGRLFLWSCISSVREKASSAGGRGWLPWLQILALSLYLFLCVSQTTCPVSGGCDTGFGLWAESCCLEMSGKWAER